MIDPAIKEAISQFFALIWDIFVNTEIPYFNINFGQIYIGLFATSVFCTFLQKTLDNESNYGSGNGDYKYRRFEKNVNKFRKAASKDD